MTAAIAVLGTILLIVAVGLALPSFVFFLECGAALLPRRHLDAPVSHAVGRRVVVLIPAHDEEAAIRDTLLGLQAFASPEVSLLVVADNCTDQTAEMARSTGATVIERHDPLRRGKGYALEFGIAHLESDPPDVVEVIDADCQASPGSLQTLAAFSLRYGRPAQADNLQVAPERASPLASVSALAFLVRNRVRPTGLSRMGLPCHLMGTGMAFPWKVLRAAPPTGSHLVEDMLMGIELASLGLAPMYCADAHVTSLPPKRNDAARGQRRRWEHGHLATLFDRAPKLIARGILQRRMHLLTMGLDLLVPPLALLVILLAFGLIASMTLAVAWGDGAGAAAAWVFASALGLVVVAVLFSWLKFGRQVVKARHLLAVPFYMLWKVPLYFSLLLRGRHRNWERAERAAKSPDSVPNR